MDKKYKNYRSFIGKITGRLSRKLGQKKEIFPLDKRQKVCYNILEQTRGALWLRRKCRTLQPDLDNTSVGSFVCQIRYCLMNITKEAFIFRRMVYVRYSRKMKACFCAVGCIRNTTEKSVVCFLKICKWAQRNQPQSAFT